MSLIAFSEALYLVLPCNAGKYGCVVGRKRSLIFSSKYRSSKDFCNIFGTPTFNKYSEISPKLACLMLDWYLIEPPPLKSFVEGRIKTGLILMDYLQVLVQTVASNVLYLVWGIRPLVTFSLQSSESSSINAKCLMTTDRAKFGLQGGNSCDRFYIQYKRTIRRMWPWNTKALTSGPGGKGNHDLSQRIYRRSREPAIDQAQKYRYDYRWASYNSNVECDFGSTLPNLESFRS